jgi:hypothetical protein
VGFSKPEPYPVTRGWGTRGGASIDIPYFAPKTPFWTAALSVPLSEKQTCPVSLQLTSVILEGGFVAMGGSAPGDIW